MSINTCDSLLTCLLHDLCQALGSALSLHVSYNLPNKPMH